MKKGFTLIELLAVILIIGIIALIAIPIVNGIIETARASALKDSAYGLVSSAEIYYASKLNQDSEDIEFTCSNSNCISNEEKLDFKGSVETGRVKIYNDGRISVCIQNNTTAAYKPAIKDKVITEKGACNYDSEDYSIDSNVSLNAFNKLKEELEQGKLLISQALTKIGIPTSQNESFNIMANSISSRCPKNVIFDQACGFNSFIYKGLNLQKFTGGNDYKLSAFMYDSAKARIKFGNINATDASSVYFLNTANLTNYDTLTVTVENSYYGGKLAIGKTTALLEKNVVFKTKSGGGDIETYTIDVSDLSGEYYIGFLPGTNNSLWCEITSLILE